MQKTGRERRRKGWYHRLRRVLYGVMLWTAVPCASAADDIGGRRAHGYLANLSAHMSAWLTEKRPIYIQVTPEPAGDFLLGFDPHNVGTLAPKPLVQSLLSFRIEDDITAMRKGAGFDLAVPDLGYVYINLYSGRNAGSHGKRWKLNPENSAQQKPQLWLLGGAVDLVRDSPNGSRQLNINPQLVLDLHAILGVNGECEANIQYANWRGHGEENRTLGRVPQMLVKWRF